MKILIGCEYSGVVREAFAKKGHNVWSCDLMPTEIPGNHYQGDIFDIINNGWDMMIAHPPCTFLSIAGYHYSLKNTKRMKKTFEALEFFKTLFFSNILKICCENPVSMVSTFFRKPDQIIQPYMFGHSEMKTTCLWLKGLPPLLPVTNINVKPDGFIIRKTGRYTREKYNYYWRQYNNSHERSRTFQGIANAMANQWG